jgi:hypothetical protein
MKSLALLLLLLAASARSSMALPEAGVGRTIKDINVIPIRVLQRSISPKFYKSLLISPIDGWVVVRGNLSGTKLTGLRVIHSEPNKLNDHLALQRAGEVTLAGNYTLDRPNAQSSVLVHLLLYQIADGTMALSFAHIDGPGGDQMAYYGCARLAVLKGDGKWVDIKGPESLEGKGVAVRQGTKNDLQSSMKLERFSSGAEATIMSGH